MFKKKYKSIAKVGGIFWKGYEIKIGEFRFAWIAWLDAKIYLMMYPHRMVTISKL